MQQIPILFSWLDPTWAQTHNLHLKASTVTIITPPMLLLAQGTFLLSLVPIGPVVSEKKLEM
jgi:hypothetical protein